MLVSECMPRAIIKSESLARPPHKPCCHLLWKIVRAHAGYKTCPTNLTRAKYTLQLGSVQKTCKTQANLQLKILRITSHQGNANKSHNEGSPQCSQKVVIKLKTTRTQQTLVRTWTEGPRRCCWWECKLVRTLWETAWRLLSA